MLRLFAMRCTIHAAHGSRVSEDECKHVLAAISGGSAMLPPITAIQAKIWLRWMHFTQGEGLNFLLLTTSPAMLILGN